ncbi:MAG: 3-deoxy-D-manno-octulosonic acid transferase [Gemmatimonadota bacterium]
MSLLESAYGLGMTAARPLLPALGALSPSLARAAAGHRVALAELRRWCAAERREGWPLVWLHGASVGELIGAVPIVELLRRESEPPDAPAAREGAAAARPATSGRPGRRGGRLFQLVVTYFSPSGEGGAAALLPDHAGYLPLDTLRETGASIDALRPAVIVFAKLDVWPNLTRAAARRGVPLALVNATVRPGSSRLSPLARRFLQPAYGRLTRVGAVSSEDAERLVSLGVRRDAIRVTGDAAFDRALARAERAPASSAALRMPPREPDVPRLVAGSTWPADEEVLLDAVAALKASGRPVELVLVPHRPEAAAIARLAGRCRRALGAAPRLWTAPPGPAPGGSPVAEDPPGERPADGAAPPAGGAPAPPPLIVDVVGVLADLYAVADIAYVGGGFGHAGLHSVIEPAAAGLPVLVGPRHDRREAAALLACGGAVEITAENARSVLEHFVEDAAARRAAGREARDYVLAGVGAAWAGAEIITEILTWADDR